MSQLAEHLQHNRTYAIDDERIHRPEWTPASGIGTAARCCLPDGGVYIRARYVLAQKPSIESIPSSCTTTCVPVQCFLRSASGYFVQALTSSVDHLHWVGFALADDLTIAVGNCTVLPQRNHQQRTGFHHSRQCLRVRLGAKVDTCSFPPLQGCIRCSTFAAA